VTHDDIRYLTKRLVLEVRWLFMLCRFKVDWDELVVEVALFGNQGNTTCAGGHRDSVKFERHQVKLSVKCGDGMIGVPPLFP
jgi:hypothetical protein